MFVLYGVLALVVLVIFFFVQAPKLNVFYVYPKKTLIWLLITSSVLLILFLVFSFLAMR